MNVSLALFFDLLYNRILNEQIPFSKIMCIYVMQHSTASVLWLVSVLGPASCRFYSFVVIIIVWFFKNFFYFFFFCLFFFCFVLFCFFFQFFKCIYVDVCLRNVNQYYWKKKKWKSCFCVKNIWFDLWSNVDILENSSNHKAIFPEYLKKIPRISVSKIFQGYPRNIVRL